MLIRPRSHEYKELGEKLLEAIDEKTQQLLFLSRARKAIVSDQINLLKSHGITDETILKDFEEQSMKLFLFLKNNL